MRAKVSHRQSQKLPDVFRVQNNSSRISRISRHSQQWESPAPQQPSLFYPEGAEDTSFTYSNLQRRAKPLSSGAVKTETVTQQKMLVKDEQNVVQMLLTRVEGIHRPCGRRRNSVPIGGASPLKDDGPKKTFKEFFHLAGEKKIVADNSDASSGSVRCFIEGPPSVDLEHVSAVTGGLPERALIEILFFLSTMQMALARKQQLLGPINIKTVATDSLGNLSASVEWCLDNFPFFYNYDVARDKDQIEILLQRWTYDCALVILILALGGEQALRVRLSSLEFHSSLINGRLWLRLHDRDRPDSAVQQGWQGMRAGLRSLGIETLVCNRSWSMPFLNIVERCLESELYSFDQAYSFFESIAQELKCCLDSSRNSPPKEGRHASEDVSDPVDLRWREEEMTSDKLSDVEGGQSALDDKTPQMLGEELTGGEEAGSSSLGEQVQENPKRKASVPFSSMSISSAWLNHAEALLQPEDNGEVSKEGGRKIDSETLVETNLELPKVANNDSKRTINDPEHSLTIRDLSPEREEISPLPPPLRSHQCRSMEQLVRKSSCGSMNEVVRLYFRLIGLNGGTAGVHSLGLLLEEMKGSGNQLEMRDGSRVKLDLTEDLAAVARLSRREAREVVGRF